MSKNAKVAWVSLIGLVGLFTHAYGFFVGLIIAIACRVGSGILAKYWEKTGHLYSSVRAVTARLRKSAKAIPAGSA
jgi:hypothetical protein